MLIKIRNFRIMAYIDHGQSMMASPYPLVPHCQADGPDIPSCLVLRLSLLL
jgi:hypothetical protein